MKNFSNILSILIITASLIAAGRRKKRCDPCKWESSSEDRVFGKFCPEIVEKSSSSSSSSEDVCIPFPPKPRTPSRPRKQDTNESIFFIIEMLKRCTGKAIRSVVTKDFTEFTKHALCLMGKNEFVLKCKVKEIMDKLGEKAMECFEAKPGPGPSASNVNASAVENVLKLGKNIGSKLDDIFKTAKGDISSLVDAIPPASDKNVEEYHNAALKMTTSVPNVVSNVATQLKTAVSESVSEAIVTLLSQQTSLQGLKAANGVGNGGGPDDDKKKCVSEAIKAALKDILALIDATFKKQEQEFCHLVNKFAAEIIHHLDAAVSRCIFDTLLRLYKGKRPEFDFGQAIPESGFKGIDCHIRPRSHGFSDNPLQHCDVGCP